MEYKEYKINSASDEAVIGAGYIERTKQADLFMYQTFTDYSMSIILDGSGMLIDANANAWPISKHSVFQCFPGQTLSLYADIAKPWREFRVKVSAPVLESLRTISSFHGGASVFQIELFPHLVLWMNDMIQSLSSGQPALLAEEFFDLQRFILNIHMQEEKAEEAFALSLIRRATILVLQEADKAVSISDLADTFYVSQARLSRIFKKYTQTTPLKYLLHVKFCYADRMLHEGMSIRDTAAMFGYADQFSFSKQFKQSMGISPSVSQRQPLTQESGKGTST